MKRNKALCLLLTALTFGTASPSYAYDEPFVNLGLTSFMDGSPPSGPGFYFQNFVQSYTSNRFNDKNGNRLPLPKTKLDVLADAVLLVYLTKLQVLGGNFGVAATIPAVLHARVDDGLNNAILDIQDGLADVYGGPALQYDPIMRKDGKGPLFVQRFEFDVLAPTGRYDKKYAINPGNNSWGFNPYWAQTYWITPKWTFSSRLHYLWMAKNNTPNSTFEPFIHTVQPGQAVFGNVATETSITEKFHVGINGYFFRQITDTKLNNFIAKGRREGVWAIGPGALYGITKEQFVFFNLYFEQDVRNRPQATNAVFRYVLHI